MLCQKENKNLNLSNISSLPFVLLRVSFAKNCMAIVIPYMAIVKLRLPAINRVQFVFWRIKMSAGAIVHCRFALSYI